MLESGAVPLDELEVTVLEGLDAICDRSADGGPRFPRLSRAR